MTTSPVIDDDASMKENTRKDALEHGRECVFVERASVASDGTEANGGSSDPAISASGRYVTYESFASNLVPDDTNGVGDVFVFDRKTDSTERVSVASDGTEGNGDSFAPDISATGRYVTYYSDASNFVPGDTNGTSDVFLFNQKTHTVERISLASDGTEGNGASVSPAISATGRHVTYESFASNLVPDDTNGVGDIFVFDRKTETTERVSVANDGTEANGDSFFQDISASGRYVTYVSNATNLVPGDTNDAADVFVFDRKTDTTERISVARDGTEANSFSLAPAISATGRYIAFDSSASNLVPDDTNGTQDIFVYDRKTDTIERISVASDGTEANESSHRPAISADGRYVTYYSFASNLVPGDTNAAADVFVYDRKTNITARVSTAADGSEGNDHSLRPDISAAGHDITYYSFASNLVPGDTNGTDDVFVAGTYDFLI